MRLKQTQEDSVPQIELMNKKEGQLAAHRMERKTALCDCVWVVVSS